MAHEIERQALASYLDDHKLKHTKQRDAILEVFLETRGHVTSEDLFKKVRELYPRIGHTTVYRTMKILCDAGLASERHFENGAARYEIEQRHHDHLLCLRCGKIIEFESATIEGAQDEVARRYGFRLLHHRHELYGHCSDCQ